MSRWFVGFSSNDLFVCVCFRIQMVWWSNRYPGEELLMVSLQTRLISLKWSSKIILFEFILQCQEAFSQGSYSHPLFHHYLDYYTSSTTTVLLFRISPWYVEEAVYSVSISIQNRRSNSTFLRVQKAWKYFSGMHQDLWEMWYSFWLKDFVVCALSNMTDCLTVKEHGWWQQSLTIGSRTRSPPSLRWRSTVG